MKVLIDGDIVYYRCAAVSENEEVDAATYRCDELIRRIIHDTHSTEYQVFINGTDNFRFAVDSEYKAHRKDVPKPKWLEQCREHIVTHWQTTMSNGIETDDELGLAATFMWENDEPFIIASLDKDLLQLPGKHFNFVKNEFVFISPQDGLRNFYKQMLIGDPADNIKGVTGIGKVKAGRAIDPLYEEKDMYELVLSLYSDEERFKRTAQLLWILKQSRNPEEILLRFHSLHEQGVETEQ